MAHLSDLLHEQRDHLYGMAKSVVHILESLNHDTDIKRIYATKYRIKSYSSVRSKLLTHFRSENLHNDPTLTMDRLMRTIPDIVGVRVVCLFQDDVDRIVNKIVNRHMHTKVLEVLPIVDSDGKPKRDEDDLVQLQVHRYVYDLPLHEVPKDPTWQNALRRHTGYTSIHLICAPAHKTRLHYLFGKLRCEIQVRTILEEAWAETSHYIAYKKSTTVRTTNDLRRLMGRITPMNQDLAQICDDATIARNADEFRYIIQVSKDYDFDPRKDLGDAWMDQLAMSQDHRRNRKHGFAQKIHHELRTKAENGEGIPENYIQPVRDILECERALDLLNLSEPSSLSAAMDLYESVLKRDKNNFWAIFRLAYVYSRKGQLLRALDYCERAITVFNASESLYPWLEKWWDTRGLEVDLLAYKGTCIWQSAFADYRSAFGSGGLRDEKFYRDATEKHERAITTVRSALKIMKEFRGDKDIIKSQKLRCHNNLAYYLTQAARYDEAQRYANYLRDSPNSPLHLHTMAWYEFKNPDGDKERALTLSAKAIDLLEPVKSLSQASLKTVQLIQQHNLIIYKCVEEKAKYTLHDEYWAWDEV